MRDLKTGLNDRSTDRVLSMLMNAVFLAVLTVLPLAASFAGDEASAVSERGAAAPAAESAPAPETPAPAVRVPDGLIDEVKRRGVLVVAQVDVDQPPFFWRDGESGEWKGYEIDLGALIASRLGVRLEMLRLEDDYNEVCRAVYDGRADIGISNLSDTEARRQLVDFTNPYIVSRVAMLVDLDGLDKSGIEAIEPADLNRPEVKVVITRESAYEFVVDELMPEATRVVVPQGDFDQIAQPFLAGEAHVLVDDGLVLNLGMTLHPELVKRYYLHIFDEYDDPLSICLPHDQPGLRELINGIIAEIEAEEPVTLEFLVDTYMK